jgi:hypothetical protein
MSSRFGAQHRPTVHGGASARGRFQSGFVPASADKADPEGSAWLVNVGGSDTVEMTGDEIARACHEGRLDPQALVWRQGMLEWSALCAVPQLSMALDRLRSVRTAVPADISEDDLTELWAPLAGGPEPGPPPSVSTTGSDPERLPEDEVTELWGSGPASHPSVDVAPPPPPPPPPYDSEPERLPEDEVTELWRSGQGSYRRADVPRPPSAPYGSELERLPDDEVTHLWGSRVPDLEAIEDASVGVDDAPTLTFEEIEYDDEQLAEDEVTALWAEHAESGLAAMERALPRAQRAASAYAPARPPPRSNVAGAAALLVRGVPPQPPVRHAVSPVDDRLTLPSMARIADMRGRVDSPFEPYQSFERPAGITTLAFWVDGVRGLYDLASTRLEWVVDQIIRLAEHRGGAASQSEGFQSRTAVVLTELRTAVTDVVLATLKRLGQWTAGIAARATGRTATRRW